MASDVWVGALVSSAKKHADQIVAQAKAQADQLLTETKDEIERLQAAAQRELGELTRQKESISGYLVQIRQLLSAGASSSLAPGAWTRSCPGWRGWIPCRAVIGAKPAAVCRWIFTLLGACPGDTLDDLFPGSGATGRGWAAF